MSKNIVLIGMPGCGKSTIGYELSKKLSLEFIDVDTYIEKNEEMTISSMFEISEEYFRQIESKYIEKISKFNSTVISTGGGVVKNECNMLLLKKSSIIIYINRKIEDIISDIDDSIRPLLKDNKERLYELYRQRHHLYQKYCNIEVLNNSNISSIVEKIYGIILNDSSEA
ncbi:MAG TPA: shikimate kinase [Clostridiales bacterium]|nr:shikimate kinase [Clostridiales bacterium]